MDIRVETIVSPERDLCTTKLWYKVEQNGCVVEDQIPRTQLRYSPRVYECEYTAGSGLLPVLFRDLIRDKMSLDPYERILGIRIYSDLRKILYLEQEETVRVYGPIKDMDTRNLSEDPTFPNGIYIHGKQSSEDRPFDLPHSVIGLDYDIVPDADYTVVPLLSPWFFRIRPDGHWALLNKTDIISLVALNNEPECSRDFYWYLPVMLTPLSVCRELLAL